MSFSINTNVSAFNTNFLNKSLNALSSGNKLNNTAYNASALSISNQLSAQVRGLGQAVQNSNESIGMFQIADKGLSAINENMQRVRTLTLQASNGTLGEDDRAIIQKEIDALLKYSDKIAKSTSYGGTQLLDGTGGSFGNASFVTQSGSNSGNTTSVTISDSSVVALLGSINITTQSGRNSAMDSVDNALQTISATRSDIGSAQNQLMANVSNISVSQINSASVQSQMRDVDFAQESANFSRQNLMTQIGSFAQAQASLSSTNRVNSLLNRA